MKRIVLKYLVFLLFLVNGISAVAQRWVARSSFPGIGMRSGTGFSIGNKGYIVNGSNGATNSIELWEYDGSTNIWTRKANFPGVGRRLGDAFVIGTDAYVGLGWNGAVSYQSMYKYNSLTDTWSQIADYPGIATTGARAEAVNGKGYVIGGRQAGIGPFNEFYEYDPVSNTWRQILNYPIGARSEGIVESIGNALYVGLGHNYSQDFDDLWKYIPSTNTWVQLATLPGKGRLNAMSFEVNGELIVGGGYRLGSGFDIGTYYRYLPNRDTWEEICGFNTGDRSNSASFSDGTYGYVVGGWRANNINTVYRYSAPAVLITDTFYCEGSTLNLDVSKLGYSYLWQDSSTTSRYAISSPGIYTVQYSYGGCKSSENFNVVERPSPKVNLGEDTIFCDLSTYLLDANQNSTSTQYVWQDNSNGPQLSVSNTGIYWVDVMNNGCTTRDSISITYNQNPNVSLGADQVICDGDEIVLDATYTAATYLWNDNSTGPTLRVSEGGMYWVEVQANGCVTRDSVVITSYTRPNLDLGNDTVLCSQTSFVIDPKLSVNGARYKWQDNSTNPTLNVSSTGEYWVEVTLGSCLIRDTIQVTFSELSNLTLGDDRIECEGESVFFDVAFPGATYLWQDNARTPNYTVTESGLYWVNVSASSCSIADSVYITFSPTPVVDFGKDTLMCSSDTLILDATFSNAQYRWHDGSRLPQYVVVNSGTYSVESHVGRCEASDTINVTFIKAPNLNFGEDKVLCYGEDHIINLNPKYTNYLWQDGSEKSRFIIEDPGTYSVFASNVCGFDTDTISIDYRNCACDIFMPNAFSPNGDGHNDMFGTTYECAYQEYSFQIFNRWGELLFETHDQYQKWDGRYHGKVSPPGNYIYSIRYSLKGDGLYENLNGSFLLLK